MLIVLVKSYSYYAFLLETYVEITSDSDVISIIRTYNHDTIDKLMYIYGSAMNTYGNSCGRNGVEQKEKKGKRNDRPRTITRRRCRLAWPTKSGVGGVRLSSACAKICRTARERTSPGEAVTLCRFGEFSYTNRCLGLKSYEYTRYRRTGWIIRFAIRWRKEIPNERHRVTRKIRCDLFGERWNNNR